MTAVLGVSCDADDEKVDGRLMGCCLQAIDTWASC